MRILKRIVVGVVIVMVAAIVIGMMLPRQVAVTRSIEINAPATVIFPYVNSLNATANWSPWLDRDPDVQVTYSGPDAGVGAKMAWTSDHRQVGNGTQEITGSVENSRVETALDFGDMGNATAHFVLEQTDDVTAVTWGLDVDMGGGRSGAGWG